MSVLLQYLCHKVPLDTVYALCSAQCTIHDAYTYLTVCMWCELSFKIFRWQLGIYTKHTTIIIKHRHHLNIVVVIMLKIASVSQLYHIHITSKAHMKIYVLHFDITCCLLLDWTGWQYNTATRWTVVIMKAAVACTVLLQLVSTRLYLNFIPALN